VYYFAPDRLEWETMEVGFTDFLLWCFSGDLELFYHDYRWPGWQAEVQALGPDQGFSIYPPPYPPPGTARPRSEATGRSPPSPA
jgi:hypothetical protein